MDGLVFNIQKFSLHDGPGIRTTIFFKGCSNACTWCHNPESIHTKPEIFVYNERCINCGACVDACLHGARSGENGARQFIREKCIACGACVGSCFAQAIETSGMSMTVDQVMAEVLTDVPYYQSSNGGVTLSGGEPFVQSDFAVDILKECKKHNIHTVVQTAGNYPWKNLEKALSFIDLVMFDLKALNPEIYTVHIRGNKTRIVDNLENLAKTGTAFVVRTPVIKGVNDTCNEIEAIVNVIKKYPDMLYYELLSYHSLGSGKYERSGHGQPQMFTAPDKATLHMLKKKAQLQLADVRCNDLLHSDQ